MITVPHPDQTSDPGKPDRVAVLSDHREVEERIAGFRRALKQHCDKVAATPPTSYKTHCFRFAELATTKEWGGRGRPSVAADKARFPWLSLVTNFADSYVVLVEGVLAIAIRPDGNALIDFEISPWGNVGTTAISGGSWSVLYSQLGMFFGSRDLRQRIRAALAASLPAE